MSVLLVKWLIKKIICRFVHNKKIIISCSRNKKGHICVYLLLVNICTSSQKPYWLNSIVYVLLCLSLLPHRPDSSQIAKLCAVPASFKWWLLFSVWTLYIWKARSSIHVWSSNNENKSNTWSFWCSAPCIWIICVLFGYIYANKYKFFCCSVKNLT